MARCRACGAVRVVEPDFRVVLPVPPSANALFTTRAGSRQRIKADAYRAWIAEAGWAVARATVRLAEPIKHARVEMDMPFSYRRDISNGVKAVEDLLKTHGIIVDDRWIEELVVRRVPATQPMEVRAWRL